MFANSNRDHFVKFTCDESGKIEEIIADDNNFFSIPDGKIDLDTLFPSPGQILYLKLIESIKSDGFAYCGDISLMRGPGEKFSFSLFGVLQEQSIVVLAVQVPNHLHLIFDEFIKMLNEHSRLLREAQKKAKTPADDKKEILDIYVQTNNHFSKLHRELQKTTSELKQAYKKIKEISRVDSLTHVLNRRFFEIEAEEELQRSKRYGLSTSLLYMDLDKFKIINDKYGHAAGDYVLAKFAGVCKKQLRENDLIGRLGGDEFCILLIQTSLDEAKLIAERIRFAVEQESFQFENRTIAITTSIGISLYSSNSGIDSLMASSGDNLYKAKKSGRNRVIFE